MVPGVPTNSSANTNTSLPLTAALFLFRSFSATPTPQRPPLGPSTCVDSVVVDLRTTVTINHFHQYYDGPIDTFTPSYVALADGSLVNPPLLDDLKATCVKLAVLSALFMFFLINALTATRYLYRRLVKNKTLFYLLLTSQTFGVIAMIAMLIPFFNTAANCLV